MQHSSMANNTENYKHMSSANKKFVNKLILVAIDIYSQTGISNIEKKLQQITFWTWKG